MAVEDKYVDSDVAANNLVHGLKFNGATVIAMRAIAAIAAADDDGSVYRLFRSVPANLIPLHIDIVCDAITGGTDYDLGFYKPLAFGGTVVDKDNLMDGQTLASALTCATGQGLGMKDVSAANQLKKVWEHAGHTSTTKLESYDIALTGNTVGTGAGNACVTAYFAQSN